ITASVAASVAVSISLARVSTAQVRSGVETARGADQPTDLFADGGVFSTAVDLMLFIIGAVAVIMIIFGGFRYVISGGNAASVTAAKNTILYAIIGIIIALLSYAIIDFVLDNLVAGGNAGL